MEFHGNRKLKQRFLVRSHSTCNSASRIRNDRVIKRRWYAWVDARIKMSLMCVLVEWSSANKNKYSTTHSLSPTHSCQSNRLMSSDTKVFAARVFITEYIRCQCANNLTISRKMAETRWCEEGKRNGTSFCTSLGAHTYTCMKNFARMQLYSHFIFSAMHTQTSLAYIRHAKEPRRIHDIHMRHSSTARWLPHLYAKCVRRAYLLT